MQQIPMVYAPTYFSIADCMPKIFELFEIKDQLNASLVNKYFNALARNWINAFGRSSGIEPGRIIPFLKQSIQFFPEIANLDLSNYPTVQNFFHLNAALAAARLNVGEQMPELADEILISLKQNGLATDRFNLYQAIRTDNIPLLNTLLDTFDVRKNCWEGHSITKKCRENDKTLSTTSISKVIQYTIRNGSLEALKSVVHKFSIRLSTPTDVFETRDLAKIDFLADFIDEKICAEDSSFTSIYGNPHKFCEGEIDTEMFECLTIEEESYDVTFGGLLKVIARGNNLSIENLVQKVWVVEAHTQCALKCVDVNLVAYLRERMHIQQVQNSKSSI